jgi:outer membrane protein
MRSIPIFRTVAALAAICLSMPASAEEGDEPRRTRVGLGAQLVPSFPGSDSLSVRPLVDIARARGDEPFEFEAPDESFGFALFSKNGFAIGPAVNLEGKRTADDVGADLPKVDFSVEAGAFAQYELSESFRVRMEVRKGLTGHKGVIGNIGADFVARDKDEWLFSVGPRLTFADKKHHRAYFSVAPEDSLASGLPAYSAGGGIQSAGATAGFLRQLSERWGIYSYAKYDRLVGDAAESPIVRQLGSRDQLSGGLALTYTFGGS